MVYSAACTPLYLPVGPFSTTFPGNFIALFKLLFIIWVVIWGDVCFWKIAGIKKKNGIILDLVIPATSKPRWTFLEVHLQSPPPPGLGSLFQGTSGVLLLTISVWLPKVAFFFFSYMTFCIFPPEQQAWWEALVICKHGWNHWSSSSAGYVCPANERLRLFSLAILSAVFQKRRVRFNLISR